MGMKKEDEEEKEKEKEKESSGVKSEICMTLALLEFAEGNVKGALLITESILCYEKLRRNQDKMDPSSSHFCSSNDFINIIRKQEKEKEEKPKREGEEKEGQQHHHQQKQQEQQEQQQQQQDNEQEQEQEKQQEQQEEEDLTLHFENLLL